MNEIETIQKMINTYDWHWVSSKPLPCSQEIYFGLKQILRELEYANMFIELAEKHNSEDNMLEALATYQYVLDNGYSWGSELPECNYDELISEFHVNDGY